MSLGEAAYEVGVAITVYFKVELPSTPGTRLTVLENDLPFVTVRCRGKGTSQELAPFGNRARALWLARCGHTERATAPHLCKTRLISGRFVSCECVSSYRLCSSVG